MEALTNFKSRNGGESNISSPSVTAGYCCTDDGKPKSAIHRKGGEIVDVFEFESERIWAEDVLPILRKLSDEDKREVIASIDAYIFELNKENKR